MSDLFMVLKVVGVYSIAIVLVSAIAGIMVYKLNV